MKAQHPCHVARRDCWPEKWRLYTVTEVAHRHEVDRSLVYRWRRELGVTRLAGPAKLLAVEVSEDAPAADPLPCEAQAGDGPQGDGGRIEIELPKGIRVRVRHQLPTAKL